MTDQSTTASLHTAGRIQGDAHIGGVIAAVDQRTNGAGNHWAIITIADDTSAIDVHVLPRTWLDVHHLLAVGARVNATGLLNQIDDKLSVICTSLTQALTLGVAAA